MGLSRLEFSDLLDRIYDGALESESAVARAWIEGMAAAADLVVEARRTGFTNGGVGSPDLELLLPHLRRAESIARLLSEYSLLVGVQKQGLDTMEVGLALFAPDGRRLLVNRAAKAILSDGDGFSFLDQIPAAEAPEESLALQRCLGSALEAARSGASTKHHSFLVSRPSGRRSYQVLVTVMDKSSSESPAVPAAVALFVCDPECLTEASEDVLRDLYRLTPAEARLTALVLEGRSLNECAVQLRISIHTARAQIKRVFSKTRTRRQSDLVRLLLGGVAGHRA